MEVCNKIYENVNNGNRHQTEWNIRITAQNNKKDINNTVRWRQNFPRARRPLGSLSNDDGDGKENGIKAIGLDWQNNNFARASRFFLPLLHDYNVKVPNFTLWRGREHKATTIFFFSWTSIQSFRIQLQKICQHLTNWSSWNKWDEVWGGGNSLFKWRFLSRRRCC